ncbi:MAG: very short patch repair endonuclease [Patescibacteria group bacterium]|nr:very short patch repair endonuclease [Patescibacteria group bacterium]
MDRISKEKRSRIMSKIRAKNTSPELTLRKALRDAGFRGYRVHYNISGKPDIVFVRKRIVIFVDGDFWHGYLWKKLGKIPPKEYWQEKIQKNINRAKKYNKQLRNEGWTVLRFWEHNVKKNPKKCIEKVKVVWNYNEKRSNF